MRREEVLSGKTSVPQTDDISCSERTWKPPLRLTFFSFTSDPDPSALSSSGLTRAEVFFFGAFFFTGLAFLVLPPRVARPLLFSWACRRAAKAASASTSGFFFFGGAGESLASNSPSVSSGGRFFDFDGEEVDAVGTGDVEAFSS